MKFYMAKDGFSSGPFTLAEIGKKLNCREALPQDLVYDEEENGGSWVPILNYFNPVAFNGRIYYAIKPQMTNRDLTPTTNQTRTAILRMKPGNPHLTPRSISALRPS